MGTVSATSGLAVYILKKFTKPLDFSLRSTLGDFIFFFLCTLWLLS